MVDWMGFISKIKKKMCREAIRIFLLESGMKDGKKVCNLTYVAVYLFSYDAAYLVTWLQTNV